MTKKIGVDRFVYLPLHIYRGCQRAFFFRTAITENVPDSQSSSLRRKYYHLFKQNVLPAHTQKKFTVSNVW